jgi:hypothetical protein
MNPGKKIIGFPNLVNEAEYKEIGDDPQHIHHGFFYVDKHQFCCNAVNTETEKGIVEYRGFYHAVIEKALPVGAGRGGGIVKPGAYDKVDHRGGDSQTDNDIIQDLIPVKITEDDKQDDHVADIKGKPGDKGNVVKGDELPYRKKKQQRRMGKNHQVPLFCRSAPVSQDKTPVNKSYGQHIRQKTETVKGIVIKETNPLEDQDQGKNAVKDKVLHGSGVPEPLQHKEKIHRSGDGA